MRTGSHLARTPLAALVAGAIALSGGCRVKHPPDAAGLRASGLPNAVTPTSWTASGAAAAGPVADGWLLTFHDDRLTAAVAEALAYNTDLQVAGARVEEAMLRAKLAGAKLYPAADLLGRAGGKMSGDNSGLQGAALTVTWEADLWARVRYGRAAASADAASARADFVYSRQSMVATVARAWFLAVESGLQLALGRETVATDQALVSLAESRAQVGIGNDEDIVVSRASLSTSQDALRQIELARTEALRALEILLGRYPAAAADVSGGLPDPPDAVPAGLPSELLERRPDVIAAERRVAAAFDRVGEAKAARLPKITLTTGVSAISSDLFVLVDRDNPIWNFGVGLLAPIFHGGELKTTVQIRSAEQREAVAAYAAVGLRAFGDVENALAAEAAAHDRERLLTAALADQRRALEIVQTRFRVGNTDLRAVNERQLAVNATSAALIAVQTEQRVQRVNLHLALGGNADLVVPPTPTTAPAAAPAQ